MKASLKREIRHRGNDLFQNKTDAIALKRLVKACFTPQFIYHQPSTSPPTLERMENGPSFISQHLTSPTLHRPPRLSIKAFVSKKLKQKVREQVRCEMEAVREQTEQICCRMRNAHMPLMSRTISVKKCSTPSTTNRSMVENEPKRIIFKLPL